MVGKATSGRRGLGNPDGVWGPEKLLIRCSRSPSRVGPGPPVEHQENEKDTTLMAIRVGVKMLQLCSASSSLSHANIELSFRTFTNKVRGTYIYKEVFTCLLFIASVCILHEHVYENTTMKKGIINSEIVLSKCLITSQKFQGMLLS